MASLSKYLNLMREHPQLFTNPSDEGVIKIITDVEQIKLLQDNLKRDYKRNGKNPDWIEIGVLSEDPWFWVLRDLVEFPDGKLGGYLRVINRKTLDGGTNVVIFPVLNEKVVLLKRFNHDARDWIWEIPHGFGEPGLTAENCARKELKEETGLMPKSLFQVGSIAGVDGKTNFYYAELFEGELIPDHAEGISKCEPVTLPKFEEWLFTGKINNWCSVLVYFMCRNKGIFG